MLLSFFCMKSHVAVATRLLFLEFIQCKSTPISDIYRLYERIQILNRQKSPKGTMSLQSSSAPHVTVKF